MTRHEMAIVAQTVLLEAEAEPFIGKLGVAYTIINRMRRHSLGAYQVCWAPFQFSCWLQSPEQLAKRMTNAPNEAIIEAWKAVELANDGSVADPTNGATNYLNVAIVTATRPDHDLPSWVGALEHTVTLGNHDFYKER